MNRDQNDRFPRLSSFLALKGQELIAAITVQDVAGFFDGTPRSIQAWISEGLFTNIAQGTEEESCKK